MNPVDEYNRTPLRALAEVHGLPIGTAIDLAALVSEPKYREVLRREFNLCVAENVFKPHLIWTGPHTYDFDPPDQIADFARQNDMMLRGHTLVWHQAVPEWLRGGGYSSSDVRDMLKAYIQTIVARYRGRISQWDVVNEAVTDGGADLREDSFWCTALGPDYIKAVFQWAAESDPEARLYYNDYGAEDMGPKADKVYALVSSLQAEGVPIHGVGLQCHFELGWRSTDDFRSNVHRLEALGLDWQVTECDIRMQLGGEAPTVMQLATQAAGYKDLVYFCLNEARCRGFLFWGFTDRHSWIPGFRSGWGAALPLDAEYAPKPAYDAIAAALWEGSPA